MDSSSSPPPRLSEEFLRDFELYSRRFDSLLDKDSFEGPQLEQLTCELLRKHADYLAKFPFTQTTRYPDCSQSELVEEDMAIVTLDELAKNSSPPTPEAEASSNIPEYACVLSELWRRASCACYLRVTLNRAREGREDDRREAVELGRKAIRYNPHNFKAVWWYTIALGYYLDSMKGPRDRSIYGHLFLQATLRCQRLNPNDSLSHSLLARYYYNVASLSWLERKVAKGLLGAQVEGSFADAERELRLAHSLQPDWMPTGLWMARVLLAQKKPLDEIREWIDFGLEQEVLEPSTEIERRELLELRSKLKLRN